MQPAKDDKTGTPEAATTGPTAENGSNVETPDVATARPSTAPGPTTATNGTGGISMVQGPSIRLDPDLILDPVPTSGPSVRIAASRPPSVDTRIRSATSLYNRSEPQTFADASIASGYSEAASTVFQREIAAVTDYHQEKRLSITPSLYTLDREVMQYIKRRESAVYDFYPGTERTDYDYVSERTDMYTTNIIESTAHLIKGSLGGAVLSMHEAYMIGGLWTSVVVTITVGILTAYTMFMLITSAQKLYRRLRITKLSYPDLAEAAAATAPWNWVRNKSKVFRYIVEVTLLFQMVGTCCIYHIVIANSMKQIFITLDPNISSRLNDIRLYILISSPLLLLLCLIKSLKWLSPFALAADIFIAICVLTTMYYSVLAFGNVNILDRAAWKDIHGFIRVFGICMYGTSGICVALPVENNMRSPKHFPIVVQFATCFVIFLSVMAGFFGYWAWGETCTSPITVHMPKNTGTTVLQFLLVLMLSITFAITFWVPFRVVWHYISRKHKRHVSLWEALYRFVMAILVMAATMIAPHTIKVMIFSGQFFLGFVALIFPAFIEFFVDWEEQYASRARVRFANNAKNFALVVLGLMISVSTFYSIQDKH